MDTFDANALGSSQQTGPGAEQVHGESLGEARGTDSVFPSMSHMEATAGVLLVNSGTRDPAARVFARVASVSQGSDTVAQAEQDPTELAAMNVAKERGNGLYSAQQYGEAAAAYTEALRLAREPGHVAALLSERSAAYASLSRSYLQRPARRSEGAALFDLDPACLAQMALRDAERAVRLRPEWGEAHGRKADALFLLERYYEAREAYLSGLEREPTHGSLQAGLRQVHELLSGYPSDPTSTSPAAAAASPPSVSPPNGISCPNPATPNTITTPKRRRMIAVMAAAADAPQGQQQQQQAMLEEWDCGLCCGLLYNPVTTPCGHSFCRGCLARALDHQSRCPYCRTVLHMSCGAPLHLSVTLAALLARAFPEEYQQRRREEEGEEQEEQEQEGMGMATFGTTQRDTAAAAAGGNGAAAVPATPAGPNPVAAAAASPAQPTNPPSNNALLSPTPPPSSSPPSSSSPSALLPLFVMSLVMPGEGLALNIFEPRYRLLVRRCMEGGRRLGLAQARRDRQGVEEVAVEAEILECQPQPDGRYYLEVVGRRRVAVGALGELDGYRVARCMEMRDEVPAPGSPEALRVSELAERLETQLDAVLARLRQLATGGGGGGGYGGGRLAAHARAVLGGVGAERPPREAVERWSMWAASLLCQLLPELDRLPLLLTRDTGERLGRLWAAVEARRVVEIGADAAAGAGGGAGGGAACVVM
ncbi:hypothetical protein Agub_g10391 [Astrephomene gubernaculifera]|uniref:LON peptidase N-terminal domain and RING finger protein 3 n=1 Tax=Astrephomene gubernaculifera TaxID=47775 RepID=A0AAD3DV98_9CHLO|nr:hypothetical protein Agub_g10391 [Astrephomene gubernaculifera]